MTYSTSTDVTFGGAWWNRVAAKQEDSHSTAPADKQINKDTVNHSREWHFKALLTYSNIERWSWLIISKHISTSKIKETVLLFPQPKEQISLGKQGKYQKCNL